jgi:penicillin-binding protein 1A
LIYDKNDEENKIKILTKNEIENNSVLVSKLRNFISNLKLTRIKDDAILCNVKKEYIKPWSFRVDSDSCITLWFDELLNFLNSIKISDNDKVIEYQTWRKDYILWRMLEDKYISFDQYKEAILDSFGYEFKKYSSNIKYPYFVMYIKEYLENKYWKDVINQGWFKIYTTLDSKLQDKAEELIKKYWDINETRFWAKNDALISIDNKNWAILSMVGWRDYFDEENWGNNNMITSRLQPGSTFKPFAYALAIENNKIGSKTPVYDVKTTFPGGYSPHNFDWKYMWKMNISTALNNSRNIPAIKMFYLAWWEEKIISFMEKLWVKTLRKFKEEYKEKHPNWDYSYSAPMALWTWLMTPLELAWAYSTFANLWVKKQINPIIKIVDRNWNIIEDNSKLEGEEKESISASLAYIMNSILSDTSSRPSFWNTYMSLSWRKLAAKTWTSTKQYIKNWRKIIAPRNLWTVWYTPQITTVVWVWNTSGKELYLNWNWLEAAGPIMKDFMSFAHRWKKVESWSRPIWVKTIWISKISGLLPRDWFPSNFIVDSNFMNVPNTVDNSLKEVRVDSLCNW